MNKKKKKSKGIYIVLLLLKQYHLFHLCNTSHQINYKDCCEKIYYCTILSLNNSRLHLVQVLFDTQLFVLDHLLLLVHSFLDLLAHHLELE